MKSRIPFVVVYVACEVIAWALVLAAFALIVLAGCSSCPCDCEKLEVAYGKHISQLGTYDRHTLGLWHVIDSLKQVIGNLREK